MRRSAGATLMNCYTLAVFFVCSDAAFCSAEEYLWQLDTSHVLNLPHSPLCLEIVLLLTNCVCSLGKSR